MEWSRRIYKKLVIQWKWLQKSYTTEMKWEGAFRENDAEMTLVLRWTDVKDTHKTFS